MRKCVRNGVRSMNKEELKITGLIALALALIFAITGIFVEKNKLDDAKAEVEDLQFKLDSADAIYKITSDTAKLYMKNYIDLNAEYNKLKADFSNMKDERDYYRDLATEYAVPGIEAEMDEIDQLIEEALKGIS